MIPRDRFALGAIYVQQGSEGGVTSWKLGAEPMAYISSSPFQETFKAYLTSKVRILSNMALQTININYTPEGRLSLIDNTTGIPLYHVKVTRQSPQMEMIRLSPALSQENSSFPADEKAYFASRLSTAQFKMSSLNVKLRIRDHRDIELKRKGILSTSYSFSSPALTAAAVDTTTQTTLCWEADDTDNTLGDFRLVVDATGEVDRRALVRFRNRAFSNERVGTFELDSDLDQLLKDEAVISGLATLAMVQSMNLAGMVMFKGG
ncbi:unnamed protein product [Penicillium salamii]|uniref:Uncharacterized protein n=1 Tax=Penicillium salamii TaxID=1612424 RepID=A0A9W4IQK0_9EURO|nr:unnamed protein product [Penicillium salamii]